MLKYKIPQIVTLTPFHPRDSTGDVEAFIAPSINYITDITNHMLFFNVRVFFE